MLTPAAEPCVPWSKAFSSLPISLWSIIDSLSVIVNSRRGGACKLPVNNGIKKLREGLRSPAGDIIRRFRRGLPPDRWGSGHPPQTGHFQTHTSRWRGSPNGRWRDPPAPASWTRTGTSAPAHSPAVPPTAPWSTRRRHSPPRTRRSGPAGSSAGECRDTDRGGRRRTPASSYCTSAPNMAPDFMWWP